jgi:hypothetical protein
MTLAPKIILHLPLSDEGLLDDFVEQCLHDNVSIVAVVGPGCERIEDIIDEIVVGDASDPERFLVTTSHANEPFEEVLNMVEVWEAELGGAIAEIRL